LIKYKWKNTSYDIPSKEGISIIRIIQVNPNKAFETSIKDSELL